MRGLVYAITLALIFAVQSSLQAQPAEYYSTTEGLTGIELKQVLHEIINDHSIQSYSSLWTHFQRTDRKEDGTVWDIYSDIPGATPPYTYYFINDQCGNYSAEGDCYNREHSFPKSWFGGEISPMYTDLFHIYPTDGYVNNRRANWPLGSTDSPDWTSLNGSRVGSSSVSGYSGIVFEPVDEYKGDLARSILYMAVRYYGEDASWPVNEMTIGAEPKPWAIVMLLNWHNFDPVSQKEINRNDSVFLIQGNRNPFIDKPEFVQKIWDSTSGEESLLTDHYEVAVYPNPSSTLLKVDHRRFIGTNLKLFISSLTGQILYETDLKQPGLTTINIAEYKPGTYLLILRGNQISLTRKFVITR